MMMIREWLQAETRTDWAVDEQQWWLWMIVIMLRMFEWRFEYPSNVLLIIECLNDIHN